MKEWITGRNPVYEVLRAGRRQVFRLLIAQGVKEKGIILEILHLCSSKAIPVAYVSRKQIDGLSQNNQGIALETEAYPYSSFAEILATIQNLNRVPLVLILDALQDPQNLGTLLRTAETVGVQGVLLPLRQSATVTPAVVHASAGASDHLLIAQANLAQSISRLKQAGVWVVGLENRAEAQTPARVPLGEPLALVVGNENQGMRQLVRESCDLLMRLPMRGRIDSLNAAVAGSIALFLAWQARGYPAD